MSSDSSGNLLAQYSLDNLKDNLVNDSSNLIPLVTLKDIWGQTYDGSYSAYNSTVINSYNDEYLLFMTTSLYEFYAPSNPDTYKHMIFVLKYSSVDEKYIIDFSLNIPAVTHWWVNITIHRQILSSFNASISDIGEQIIVNFTLNAQQTGRTYFIIKDKDSGK